MNRVQREFRIPVTKWLPDRKTVQGIVEDLIRQQVSFGVARRKGTYSVWRKRFTDDPSELMIGKPPVDFVEVYTQGKLTNQN